MGRYEAVMFDWVLTLADLPDRHELVRRAMAAIDRTADQRERDELVQALEVAGQDADVVSALTREDCSTDLHLAANMLHYGRAGVDDELAAAMYALLGSPSFLAVYPGVADLLEEIAQAGIAVAVVSDIHVDLRGHAAAAGIDHLVEHWILSFEHGVQKPDPAIFRLALDALGAEPARTLMVGDRASHDGIAASLGVDTLILPVRAGSDPVGRLDPVRALLLR